MRARKRDNNKDLPSDAESSILLLGNYRPTLAIARSLRPLGYRVVVAGSSSEGTAEYSRHVDRFLPADQLDRYGFPRDMARAGVALVMPVTEEAALRAAALMGSDPGDPVWVTPAAEIVTACLDKPAMFARCEALGIPTRPHAVTTRRDLVEAVRRIGTACVVRPEYSSGERKMGKAVFVDGADLPPDLAALAPDTRLIVQAKAEGRRHNLYFAACNGSLSGICHVRIDRTDQPDGTGLAVEGTTVEPDPDLVAATRALTESLDYTGIGCAQFLVDDATGATSFLEINPRVPGNQAIPEAAGLPLARLSVDLAIGRTPPGPMIIGRAGVRFAWTYGDLRGLYNALRRGRISASEGLVWFWRSVATALGASVHMTWTWDDPLPTMALIARRLFHRRPSIRPVAGRNLTGAQGT